MRDLSEVVTAASVAIDAANAADPTSITWDGAEHPLALIQGRVAADWITRLSPSVDAAAMLAARAHHLRRWEVPRSSYPEGRAGYLRWRRDQKARHARDVAVLLDGAGADGALVARVQTLIERRDLRDPGCQVVEDAACLTFVELQLASTAATMARDKLVDVVRKTLVKMSPAAITAAQGLTLPAVSVEVIEQAAAALTDD
ncbi:MAG: DUF4202 domain-containing protein [Acidimicrobiia bacterium]